MIEWIFFDLGSTLLDEEAAYGYYIDKCVKKLESLDLEVSSDSYKKKMVEYALAGMDNQLFVSTYMLQLPDRKTLEDFLLKQLGE